ncbi:MAG: DUF423 domain-containing protein [Proteobacteria bacterium]|nr:DUF423 domain-containing protein [Pseudomonadota bacterium]
MRPWLAVAALNGLLAVGVGAIGAHALRATASPERLAWLDTGLRYHMWHALALLAVACLMAVGETRPPGLALRLSAWLFAGGIALFSFGLYLMAFAGLHTLGPIVPTGGLLLLAGWAALFIHALGRRP